MMMMVTYVQLSVKHDNFVARWKNIVARVGLKEPQEHEII